MHITKNAYSNGMNIVLYARIADLIWIHKRTSQFITYGHFLTRECEARTSTVSEARSKYYFF
jgi:hypothetical protein